MSVISSKTNYDVIHQDDILMQDVLRPYFDNTTYLKSADVYIGSTNTGKITGKGWFEIPSSCYIADTGHFNSVEFNISYNQIMYYVIAISVKYKMMRFFDEWTLETYFKKQLPDILIVNFKSKFRSPLNSKRFYGEIDFVEIKQTSSLVFVKTLCRYLNKSEGIICCEGQVDLAITR